MFKPSNTAPSKGLIPRIILKWLGDSPLAGSAFLLTRKEVKKYKALIFIGAVLIFIGALLLLPLPFVMGKIIDVVIPGRDIRLLLIIVGILLLVNLLGAVISYCQELLFFKINNKIIVDIRRVMLEKINRMPLFITRNFETGYLISRIKDDPPRLAALFGDQIIQLVKQLFTLLVSLAALFYLEWRLALLSLLIIPIFLYTVYHFGKKLKKQSEILFEQISVSTGSLRENLDMVELCKSFGRQTFNTRRYMKELVKTFRAFVDSKRIESKNSAFLSFIGAVLPLSILASGGILIINGQFSIGMLVTFMALLNNVVGPASTLIGFNIELQKLKVALNRVGEILCYPEEPFTPDKNQRLASIESLATENLTFSYDGVKAVLKKVLLKAKKGEKIGIVGPSGSGKTSLGRVLMGFYEFSGRLIVNDVSIDKSKRDLLRYKIAVVPQEPFLFNDSIYANVAIGNPEATPERIKEALKQAYAWEFVEKLENKEWSSVGESGNKLSVGQKQRIAIARALLKDADVLILDEATANVDLYSARMISKTIEEIGEDKIVFIIAHNLEMVMSCNRIVVLHEGMVSEEGTHEELLQNKGIYSGLYRQKG